MRPEPERYTLTRYRLNDWPASYESYAEEHYRTLGAAQSAARRAYNIDKVRPDLLDNLTGEYLEA